MERVKQGAAYRLRGNGLESLALKAERVKLKPPAKHGKPNRDGQGKQGHATEGREPAESTQEGRQDPGCLQLSSYRRRQWQEKWTLDHRECQIRDRVPWGLGSRINKDMRLEVTEGWTCHTPVIHRE